MVVGEPSLMGGEFGDEDERLITRLENTQYDGTNSLDHDNHGGFGHAESPLSNANNWQVDRGGGGGGGSGGNSGGGNPNSGPQGQSQQPQNQQSQQSQQQQSQQQSSQDNDKKSPVVPQ